MRRLCVLVGVLAACDGGGGEDDGSGADAAAGGVDGAVATADADPAAPDAGGGGPIAPELGDGDHGPGSVDLVLVAQSPDLVTPMDLAFDPHDGELWIVDQGDNGWTIFSSLNVAPADGERYFDDSNHFLRKPAGLAFAHNGEQVLATCQESNNGGDGFMGPVAWTSDLGKFEGGTDSHYDMLHESNMCMGIAWQTAHVFWVFNGTDGVIDRVDFHGWHPDAAGGLGGMDHSDGEYFRYQDARVQRVAGVASGMEYDPADGFLYVADTGNGRVARMPTNGAIGAQIGSQFDEVPMYSAAGTLTDVVPPGQLGRPSGLTVKGGLIYVSDQQSGVIYAYTKAGVKVNWLDTGLGAGHVGSLAIGPDGKLYFLDTPGNRLYRIDPK